MPSLVLRGANFEPTKVGKKSFDDLREKARKYIKGPCCIKDEDGNVIDLERFEKLKDKAVVHCVRDDVGAGGAPQHPEASGTGGSEAPAAMHAVPAPAATDTVVAAGAPAGARDDGSEADGGQACREIPPYEPLCPQGTLYWSVQQMYLLVMRRRRSEACLGVDAAPTYQDWSPCVSLLRLSVDVLHRDEKARLLVLYEEEQDLVADLRECPWGWIEAPVVAITGTRDGHGEAMQQETRAGGKLLCLSTHDLCKERAPALLWSSESFAYMESGKLPPNFSSPPMHADRTGSLVVCMTVGELSSKSDSMSSAAAGAKRPRSNASSRKSPIWDAFHATLVPAPGQAKREPPRAFDAALYAHPASDDTWSQIHRGLLEIGPAHVHCAVEHCQGSVTTRTTYGQPCPEEPCPPCTGQPVAAPTEKIQTGEPQANAAAKRRHNSDRRQSVEDAVQRGKDARQFFDVMHHEGRRSRLIDLAAKCCDGIDLASAVAHAADADEDEVIRNMRDPMQQRAFFDHLFQLQMVCNIKPAEGAADKVQDALKRALASWDHHMSNDLVREVLREAPERNFDPRSLSLEDLRKVELAPGSRRKWS
mmetsp:Transcript_14759/g.43325  ORF Transcript_14759/g.43325 Transcript_14759/m.43325 type:complete len:591 (+) Transcript_14759:63-1835(+)